MDAGADPHRRRLALCGSSEESVEAVAVEAGSLLKIRLDSYGIPSPVKMTMFNEYFPIMVQEA